MNLTSNEHYLTITKLSKQAKHGFSILKVHFKDYIVLLFLGKDIMQDREVIYVDITTIMVY